MALNFLVKVKNSLLLCEKQEKIGNKIKFSVTNMFRNTY